MEYEINFQDLASYIVPGAAMVLLSYWLVRGFVGLDYPVEAGNLGTIVVFIVVSYIFGHVVQALGNILEHRYERKWGGKYSDQLLRDGDSYYTSGFRAELKERIQEVFGLPVATSGSPNTEQSPDQLTHLHNEAFHLCHSLILQEQAAQHAEIFQGLYGLYRGLLAFGLVGLVSSFIFAAKEVMLLVCVLNGIPLPQQSFFSYDLMQLIASGLLFAFLLATRYLLYLRLQRFSKHYVNAVYESFFAWSVKHSPLSTASHQLVMSPTGSQTANPTSMP